MIQYLGTTSVSSLMSDDLGLNTLAHPYQSRTSNAATAVKEPTRSYGVVSNSLKGHSHCAPYGAAKQICLRSIGAARR